MHPALLRWFGRSDSLISPSSLIPPSVFPLPEHLLAVLLDISRAGAECGNLGDFLNQAHAHLERLFSRHDLSLQLYLFEQRRGYASAASVRGILSDEDHTQQAILTWMQRSAQPLVLDRAAYDRVQSRSSDAQPAPAGWISVPIRLNDRVRCALILQSEQEPAFSARDAELLACVAPVIANTTQRLQAVDALLECREQLYQAQKFEAIGSLACGVAHDFNNLLTGIRGYGEITLESLPKPHPLREGLEQMLKAADRAAQLTRQLLVFSRKRAADPTTVSLSAAVNDVEKLLRRMIGEQVELVTDVDGVSGDIRIDRSQLDQIIFNLAINARDAMPEGGRLTIRLFSPGPVQLHEWNLPQATDQRFLALQVIDTGCGMTEETRQRIFEPYFTTKPHGKGTGLGLFTVQNIVKQHGGFVHVSSRPDEGSSFSIGFPEVSPCTHNHAIARDPLPARGSETILVVDDEDGVRHVVRGLLERRGYRVLVAANGSEALQVAREHTGPVHLLVTDVVMPGMSGDVLADRLRETRPETKVVFISGYAGQIIERPGVLTEDRMFLPKPFSMQVLSERVRDILDQRKPAEAA